MEKRKKEFRKEISIGLITIISGCILFFGIKFLKTKSVSFNKDLIIYSKFDDITGLKESNNILYNGLNIGTISKIFLDDKERNSIIVELTITDKLVFIPKDSHIRMNSFILGANTISIVPGKSTFPINNKDYIENRSQSNLQQRIDLLIENMVVKVESLISNFSDASNHTKKTLENINKTFLSINDLVNDEKENIHKTMLNINSISNELNKPIIKLNNILNTFDTFAIKLNKIEVNSLNNNALTALKELNILLKNVNNENNTITKLLNDDSKIYTDLSKTIKNLDLLLEDFRLNPKRYLSLKNKSTEYKPNNSEIKSK